MRKIDDRRERNQDSARVPGLRLRRGGKLRLALALIAFALLAVVAISSAEAATGGASAYPASAPEGGEVAFGPVRVAGASWYGPGLYGRKTACGETLGKKTLGVAHRSLPCGTTVKFLYHGHVLITKVIDRGPYVH